MATYYFRNVGTDWNTASNWSLTDGGGATGAVPTAADDAYFTSNSGNCTISTASRVCLTLIFSGVGAGNYTGTFTLNNTLTVSGNITLSSGMTFAGTSTITINANSTITSNTKVFPCNITISGARTITLGDDVYVTGNISTTGAVGNTVTFNNNTLYVAGNFGTFNIGMIITNNSNVVMNGTGTFSVSTAFSATIRGTGTFSFDTTGTITILTSTFFAGVGGKTIQYVSGNVIVPRGNVLGLIISGSGTLSVNLKGIINKGGVLLASQGTISLLSDLEIDGGTVTFGSALLTGSAPLTINNDGGNLILGVTELPSSVSGSPNGGIGSGTATWIFGGNGVGTWVGQTTSILPPITFDFTGTLNCSSSAAIPNLFIFGSSRTYTYIRGKIVSFSPAGLRNRGVLGISTACTLIGFDKCSGFGFISIANGITVTMDKFFSGRPDCISEVLCSTTTGSYTITFQDDLEKFANWVRVSNCTLTRRGQLLILNQRATTSTGRNTGVRYINSWPNGVPKHSPFTPDSSTAYGAGGLLSDPAISI
jgi:hypothetical protein